MRKYNTIDIPDREVDTPEDAAEPFIIQLLRYQIRITLGEELGKLLPTPELDGVSGLPEG